MAPLFPLILRRRNSGNTSNKSKKMSSPPNGDFLPALTNFLIMICGLVIFSFGSALYSLADFGKGPYEALTFAFVHKNQWPIQNVRIILDVMCVLLGWILGGTVGICTIATIMLSGALLQKFVKILKPAIDTIVLGKAIH